MAEYTVSDYADPIKGVRKRKADTVGAKAEACPVGKAFIVRGGKQGSVSGVVYAKGREMGARFTVNKIEDGVFQVTRLS